MIGVQYKIKLDAPQARIIAFVSIKGGTCCCSSKIIFEITPVPAINGIAIGTMNGSSVLFDVTPCVSLGKIRLKDIMNKIAKLEKQREVLEIFKKEKVMPPKY